MFEPLQAKFFPRENDESWDIGGYQSAARQFPDYDLHLYLGESCYFWKPGWLARIVESWRKFGAGMYGLLSSHLVRPHLNTTAFAVSPNLMNGFPRVTDHRTRYQFEHGENSFWVHLNRLKIPVRFVTWDGMYPSGQWRSAPNILWRGDQSSLLIRCNHVDRWDAADEKTKRHWTAGADTEVRR